MEETINFKELAKTESIVNEIKDMLKNQIFETITKDGQTQIYEIIDYLQQQNKELQDRLKELLNISIEDNNKINTAIEYCQSDSMYLNHNRYFTGKNEENKKVKEEMLSILDKKGSE